MTKKEIKRAVQTVFWYEKGFVDQSDLNKERYINALKALAANGYGGEDFLSKKRREYIGL